MDCLGGGEKGYRGLEGLREPANGTRQDMANVVMLFSTTFSPVRIITIIDAEYVSLILGIAVLREQGIDSLGGVYEH